MVARCASAFTDGFFGYKDAFTVMGKDFQARMAEQHVFLVGCGRSG